MTIEKTPDKNSKETPDKNPVGRPSGLTPEFLATAKAYLMQYKELGDVFPTIEGLSVFAEVGRSTLHKWAKEKSSQEYIDIYEKLMSMQGRELINNGIKGEYNSTITKLMLTKHDYRDAN